MIWQQYFTFLDLSDGDKALVLGLFSPLDGEYAIRTKRSFDQFLAGFSPRNRFSVDLNDKRTAEVFNADHALRVTMVFHFNSVSEPTNGGGAAVYSRSCRLTHSCTPNCFWYSDDQGFRNVRSTRIIQSDEELSVDYLNETWLLMSASKRREFLNDHYNFICCCALCSDVSEYNDDFFESMQKAERYGSSSSNSETILALRRLIGAILPILTKDGTASSGLIGARRSSNRLRLAYLALAECYSNETSEFALLAAKKCYAEAEEERLRLFSTDLNLKVE